MSGRTNPQSMPFFSVCFSLFLAWVCSCMVLCSLVCFCVVSVWFLWCFLVLLYLLAFGCFVGEFYRWFCLLVVGTLAAARYNETGRNRKGLMQMFFFILLLNRMSLFENRIFLCILIRFFLWIIKENRNFNSCEVPILVPYFCKVLIYR